MYRKKNVAVLSILFLVFFSTTLLFADLDRDFWAGGYEAVWIDQTQSDTWDQYFLVEPGELVDITVRFENNGDFTWYRNGWEQQVCLAIYKDPNVQSGPTSLGYDNPLHADFGKSYFYDTSWETQYRAACIEENSVNIGDYGTFKLRFKIPNDAQNGRYREDLSLASGPYWIANNTNGDPLKVAHVWVGFEVINGDTDFGDCSFTLDHDDFDATASFEGEVTELQFLTRDRGWATIDDTIYYSSDSGDSWDKKERFEDDITAMHFSEDDTGWVAIRTDSGDDFLLYTTHDTGDDWDDVRLNQEASSRNRLIEQLFFFNRDSGIAIAHKNYLFTTENEGNDWDQSDITSSIGELVYPVDMWFEDEDRGWLLGYEDDDDEHVLLETTNHGDSWDIVVDTNRDNHTITYTDDDMKGWYFTDDRYYSIDTRLNIKRYFFELEDIHNVDEHEIISFHFVNNGDEGVAITKEGGEYKIYYTDDEGYTWYDISSNNVKNIQVTTQDDEIWLAVFEQNEDETCIFHWDEQNNSNDNNDDNDNSDECSFELEDNDFEALDTFNDEITQMQFLTANRGWLTVDDDIYFSSNGGTSWDRRETFEDEITAMHFSDDDTGWVSVRVDDNDDFLLYQTHDTGEDWDALRLNEEASNSNPIIESLFFSNRDEGIALSHKNYIFITENEGDDWDRMNITDEIGELVYPVDTWFENDNTGWIVGYEDDEDEKLLIKTTNHGDSWHTVVDTNRDNHIITYTDDDEKGWYFTDDREYSLSTGLDIDNYIDELDNEENVNKDEIISFHFVNNRDDGVAITREGGDYKIYYTDDEGESWRDISIANLEEVQVTTNDDEIWLGVYSNDDDQACVFHQEF